METTPVKCHPLRRAFGASPTPAQPRRRLGWAALGLAATAVSGAALASLPRAQALPRDSEHQWHALGIEPLAAGGDSGLRMEARDTARSIEAAPVRAEPFHLPPPAADTAPAGPQRVRGQVGDGLYWSLRAAGASADAAAQYLAALAEEIDVGSDVAQGDGFDLVLAPGGGLLYAGLDRRFERDFQLVRWGDGTRGQWLDAAEAGKPQAVATGMILPAAGRITSMFGNRVHPILRFTRFHAGLDIGAAWGSPIVAAGDGQVARAGWAGGYGRQVQIAHGGGISSSYSHMSELAVAPGTFVRRGQVIGYVGSSGFSTGPHLHFEVRQGGVPVNPLSARIVSAPIADPGLAKAVKARLAVLLKVGTHKS